ncbi:MAG: purine/pyrimidine permease [Bacillota bacterium]
MQPPFYSLDRRPPAAVTVLATVQWIAVIAASSIVVPVTVAHAFNLSGAEATGLLQRTLVLVGSASLLQATVGHRLPIVEGPAGMWWAVFLVMASIGPGIGKSHAEVLAGLEFGLLAAGAFLLVLGASGLVSRIRRVFTPLVTGTYMILLTLQLSKPFAEGILGIGYLNPAVDFRVAVISIVLAAWVFYLAVFTRGLFSNFSILIGIITGWGAFALFGLAKSVPAASLPAFSLPRPLAWGAPVPDTGIALTALVTAAILLINLIASIEVTSKAAQSQTPDLTFNRGGLLTGVSHLFSGFFAGVGLVPLSISAGFISVTRIASRLPFLIAAAALLLLGTVPALGAFLAALPAPVGYAVLVTAFSRMVAFGLRDYQQAGLSEANLTTVGLSLMLGVGVMFLPQETLTPLPAPIRVFASNGLILGVVFAIILEQLVFRRFGK